MSKSTQVGDGRQDRLLASRQLGLVGLWQLLGIGIGRGASCSACDGLGCTASIEAFIWSAVRCSPPVPVSCRCAGLRSGSAGSHHSAAGLWRLVSRTARADVRVTVPGRRVQSRPGIRVSFTGFLDPRDRRTLGAVPLTALARTIIDLAGTLEPTRVEPLDLIRRAGLPEPECNAGVGPYVVDLLWREPRLIVEFDSKEWRGDHVHGRFESDRRRDGHRPALGFGTKRSPGGS